MNAASRGVIVVLLIGSGIMAGCGEVGQAPEDEAGIDSVVAGDAQPVLRQAPPPERTQPEAGTVEERIADAMLEAQVLLALGDDNLISRYPFFVEARSGRVFVRGSVDSNAQRDRVEAVAGDVDGVRTVINEVESLEPAPTVAEVSPPAGDGDADNVEEPADEASPSSSETWHTVSSGESLWTIARRHGTSVQNIQRLNNLGSGSIRPGQRLRVR